MKKKLLFIGALIAGATLHAQTRADYTNAVASFERFYNTNQPDSLFNMFNDRMKQLVSLEQTKDMFTQLGSKMGPVNSFEFQKEEPPFNYYKTEFKNATLSFVLSLSKENKFESFRFVPYEANNTPKEKSNFTHQSGTGDIYGTLSIPATSKKVPIVLIIAGSGPTDRNGNQSGISSNCYKMLADSLQQAGIACLRYDKRGVGASQAALKDEASIRFEDMATDAAGIIKMLKEDSRFSKIIILGHSEGSLVGMLTANQIKVNGFISLAGAGESADKILKRQLSAQSQEAGAKAVMIMDSIKHGHTINDMDANLAMIFRPSVQPYLRSWFKYDPQVEIKKLAIPVMVLQGSTDIQVSEHDAQLLKKSNPKATLKIVIGMNHVLKQAAADPEQNMATYKNPALPLSTGLMQPIYAFINQTK